MKPIPHTPDPFVLHTDFSDDAAWREICAAIREPQGDFYAYVEFLDDPEFAGLSEEQGLQAVSEHYFHNFIIVADRDAMVLPGHPLLIVDLRQDRGRAIRALPSKIQSLENNLSISNMDFEDFAGAVDSDGVLRGFTKSGVFRLLSVT
jgi:hypothetical protein